jgi:hypothetical protein
MPEVRDWKWTRLLEIVPHTKAVFSEFIKSSSVIECSTRGERGKTQMQQFTRFHQIVRPRYEKAPVSFLTKALILSFAVLLFATAFICSRSALRSSRGIRPTQSNCLSS